MTENSPASLSRRSFLQIVLGTLPAAALPGGAVAALWPAAELEREVCEPWVLALDGTVLWDPAYDWALRVPTMRELIAEDYPEILTARGKQQELVLADYVREVQEICEEDDQWDACLAEVIANLEEGPDYGTADFENWYSQEQKGAAWTAWDQLPEEVREGFLVHLVEGDHPGSDFTYIRYAGELDDLNRDLVAAGLNIVVIAKSRPDDVLFPGHPDY